MKSIFIQSSLLIVLIITTMGSLGKDQSPTPALKEENVTYTIDGVSFNAFVAYNPDKIGKRPAILVVHEWWGENDYVKMRARELAALGYIAMAVDLFGNGQIAANPQEAMALTKPFYADPALAKKRLDAAINKIKEFPQTDINNVAAIGYCFGGWVVLNSAKMGSDLKGVVSFHGGLAGVPADKNLLKAKILVCHGGSDKFVSQKDVDAFKHQMDSIGADYTLKIYANATHAFTNPDATKIGKEFNMPIEYNAEADKNSWNDMNSFLNQLFK
jgi:dienelactone hydrolase